MTIPDPVGRLFGGRYRLDGLLGVGGSASVYAAEDVQEGGPPRVAVKILHPHLCSDERIREAFLREADQAARLTHPNIVAVRGSGLHDAGGVTMAWIALDLVVGPTLAEWLQASGRLSPPDAGAVLHGMLAGLGVAHAAGIVHRDVSPRNVILEGMASRPPGRRLAAGMVRLLDFGLADAAGATTVGGDVLLAGSAGDIRPEPASPPNPGEGGRRTVVGSVHFMSPEQAQGLPVGPAGDLYQAGGVLYALLTGQPPYPRPKAAQVLEAHLSAPPPVPSALVPAARPLDRVVTTAMAKDPARRFRDAEAFRVALAEALATARDSAAGPAGAPSPTRVIPTSAARTGPSGSRPPEPARPPAPRPAQGPRPGTATPAPVANRPQPPPPAPPVASGGTSGGLVAALAALAVVGVAVWAIVSASLGAPVAAEPPPGPEPSTSLPVPSVSTPSSTPSVSVPSTVVVPTLHGTLADAEDALLAAGLVLGKVSRVESPEQADRVLEQTPGAGRRVVAGRAVDVVVASGSSSVPPVSGMTAAAASAAIESAGFAVAIDPPGSSARAVVLGTEPAAGVVLRVGVTVTLLLTEPEPVPGETPGASDTPAPTDSASPAPTGTTA